MQANWAPSEGAALFAERGGADVLVPAGLALLVLPARYADSLVLLPWLAAAGTGYAAVTVLTTVLLALRAYRRSQLALLSATLLMAAGFAAGWRLGGTYGLAVGSAAGGDTGLTAPAACII